MLQIFDAMVQIGQKDILLGNYKETGENPQLVKSAAWPDKIEGKNSKFAIWG
ncbi:MAG: hypothetical protein CM15mP106_4430 [Candidatus Neomarinimicrobiota bacterium]|nr:MAG: hypothetical protein CM15mP106_4430 [Candidatus Neomarinimicrobiota bacterium]